MVPSSSVERLLAEVRSDRVAPVRYAHRSMASRGMSVAHLVALALGVILAGIRLGRR